MAQRKSYRDLYSQYVRNVKTLDSQLQSGKIDKTTHKNRISKMLTALTTYTNRLVAKKSFQNAMGKDWNKAATRKYSSSARLGSSNG